MASIGAISELINSRRVSLDVGSDTYITIQNIFLKIGRTENRIPTTDNGSLYTFGKGDSWFTASLLATTPEIDTLNTLTQIDVDGDMTSTAWKIVFTDRSAATKTFACTGVLKDIEITRGVEGGVQIDITVRITGDKITVS